MLDDGINKVREDLEELERANCLIKLDYPYHPRRREWSPATSKVFQMIDARRDNYAALFRQFAEFSPFLKKIQARNAPPDSIAPQWVNGWFPAMDSVGLYGLLALKNPRRYVEVGSGNSTMFARRAIEDHGLRTKIISIDPFPRKEIDQICDEIVRSPFENVPTKFFADLGPDDIVFIDNSHRSFANSDVTVFFTEVLPHLPSGLIYGLHDIFIPWDYPNEWKDRFYNEQYLLISYLLGGAAGDQIVMPSAYLSYYAQELTQPLQATFGELGLSGPETTGTAFWMQRG